MTRGTATVYLSADGAGSENGFSLLELLVVIGVMGIITALAFPAFSSYYGDCCMKSAAWEIVGMVKEAKQCSLVDDRCYAVGFDPGRGTVSLIADRGPDGEWNTGDDKVVRVFRLADRGGGVRFGYGSCGPIPGYAPTPDGITFQENNTIVCNPELTGNAGTVYLSASSGAAFAITVNSRDFSCVQRRWNGSAWVKL
ncbi:prepilin-type N-terminal cleavage/methylation domain-containing protein [Geobacter sp. AOG1]|uniref:prepilin-type N-terminal cleavage/methylation domain-containing protein n=1 Tax=Geobacter sp. AOG1 TaxID=1566346 RepID=UPI001CC62E07|nr:prepilin-type N-terminal cleavage/methylation domain-containing protein [Geobacter sp. AOG1]GFE58269.1 pilus biosynthesis protein PilE [Geobacter sp. AOG1]